MMEKTQGDDTADLREIHDWFVKGPEGGDGVELTAAEVEDTWRDVLAFSREAERRSLHVDETASQLAAHIVQARPGTTAALAFRYAKLAEACMACKKAIKREIKIDEKDIRRHLADRFNALLGKGVVFFQRIVAPLGLDETEGMLNRFARIRNLFESSPDAGFRQFAEFTNVISIVSGESHSELGDLGVMMTKDARSDSAAAKVIGALGPGAISDPLFETEGEVWMVRRISEADATYLVRKHADAMVKVVRNAEFELEAEARMDKVRKNAALGAGELGSEIVEGEAKGDQRGD